MAAGMLKLLQEEDADAFDLVRRMSPDLAGTCPEEFAVPGDWKAPAFVAQSPPAAASAVA